MKHARIPGELRRGAGLSASPPAGPAIIFFAAHGEDGGSIFTSGLPRRGGNFGNYTRGKIHSYHTSYTAIDEKVVPRGATHLKKNDGHKGKGNEVAHGPSAIEGKFARTKRSEVAHADAPD